MSTSTTGATPHPARRLWQHLETLHGLVYFAPDVTDALKGLGLKGFWMSYFAGRAAPLGAVGPGPVEATFYNFDPRMVRRAVPDAWRFAEPAAVLATRAEAAAGVLRQTIPDVEEQAERIVPLLTSAVRSGRADGRTLFAANQQLPLPDDPVAALWQCATSLREHRGDGHVALLVAHDLPGIDAHQLVVGTGVIDDERLRSVRGWSEEEWALAKERVTVRGLLDDDGRLTDVGVALRSEIEQRTDELSFQPYVDGLTEPGLDLLPSLLRPLSRAVAETGIIPFPNPIGLPEPR
jgi:hypothetical protein